MQIVSGGANRPRFYIDFRGGHEMFRVGAAFTVPRALQRCFRWPEES
jgi:hypothetical protein